MHTQAALEGLYELLRSLQGVMSSDAYLRALHALAGHPGDKLRRRSLRLFAAKVGARTLRAVASHHMWLMGGVAGGLFLAAITG